MQNCISLCITRKDNIFYINCGVFRDSKGRITSNIYCLAAEVWERKFSIISFLKFDCTMLWHDFHTDRLEVSNMSVLQYVKEKTRGLSEERIYVFCVRISILINLANLN